MIDLSRNKERHGLSALRDPQRGGAGDANVPSTPPPTGDDGEHAPATEDDPLRGKIPVEDRSAYEHMAREAMAAFMWVQRQRAAGRLPN